MCNNLILSNMEARLLKYNKTKKFENHATKSLRRSRCRVCLIYMKNIINIFSDNDKTDDELTIDEKLNQCISIQTVSIYVCLINSKITIFKFVLYFLLSQIRKNDGYPQFICSKCLILLDSAFKFKILVENSDQELRKLTAEVLKKGIIELK